MSELCGPGGCAGPSFCEKHGVPLVHTITEATLCAVCEKAERDWLPIDSAPKDGTRVLGFFPSHKGAASPNGAVFMMRWDSERHARKPQPHWSAEGWVWGIRDMRGCQPSHWLPIPPLPGVSRG